MKAFLWAGCGALVLLWSGASWAVASLMQWTAGLLASGQGVDAVGRMADAERLPLPAWVAAIVDPAWLQAAAGGVAATVEQLAGSGAWLARALNGADWVLWLLWAIGVVALVVLTASIHWIVSRLGGSGVALKERLDAVTGHR